MIYVRIELWPRGRKEHARLLQELTIVNDTTGSREDGNYDVRVSHATTFKGQGFADPVLPLAEETWRRGRVLGWPRGRSPAELVGHAILAVCPWVGKAGAAKVPGGG
jgi:hypothetical protein